MIYFVQNCPQAEPSAIGTSLEWRSVVML